MRITALKITNVLGLHAVELEVRRPVLVVAGLNGAGKSSLIESIRLALTNQPDRITLKKQYPQLITNGESKGTIRIWSGEDLLAGMSLPSGEWHESLPAEVNIPLLQYLLDSHQFAALDAGARASFLYDVTGQKPTPELVSHRLAEKGAKPEHIKAILPLAAQGLFPEASKEAAGRARDAKAAWKAVTGETWGDKKAEGWAAEKPLIDHVLIDDLAAQVAGYDNQVNAANQKLGEMRAGLAAVDRAAGRKVELESIVGNRKRLNEKLAVDQKELAAWTQRYSKAADARLSQGAMPCPCCNEMLVIKDGAFVKAGPLAARTEEDIAKIDQLREARDSYARAVANDQRDIAAVDAAQAELDSITLLQVTYTSDDVVEHQKAMAKLEGERKDVKTQLESAIQRRTEAAEAEKRTGDAGRHHADVVAWLAIADALGASGIPSELLQAALTPFNDLLHSLSATAGWMRVQLGTDMGLTAAQRPYHLLAESEQYRVDVVVTLAIAILSGARFLMLDRIDVLDIPGRLDLITLLNTCVSNKQIEAAIVAGTMKQAPTGLPDNCQVIWLEKGRVQGSAQKVAA